MMSPTDRAAAHDELEKGITLLTERARRAEAERDEW
jgi:hypothetical protein